MKQYDYKISALFDDRAKAQSTLERIGTEFRDGVKAFLVSPEDRQVDRKLEPETRGVRREIISNIIRGTITGLIVGAVATVALGVLSVAFVESSPFLSLLWLVFYAGGVIGGKRVTDGVHVAGIKDDLADGQLVLIAHTTDKTLASRLESFLGERAVSTTVS